MFNVLDATATFNNKIYVLWYIKNYYCSILLKGFGKFSGHDHTILINEYKRNYDVICQNMLHKNLNKSPW